MPVHERRQHFRIEDRIYFNYKILKPGNCYCEQTLNDDLLSQAGDRYVEIARYFESFDTELAQLTQALSLKEPIVSHFLNILNTKIDYLVRHIALDDKNLKKVNISLGGMSFKAQEHLAEKTQLKLVVYTKPNMVPIIINGVVVYCEHLNANIYRVAIQFEHLTQEQEQLLSQHIMLAQH